MAQIERPVVLRGHFPSGNMFHDFLEGPTGVEMWAHLVPQHDFQCPGPMDLILGNKCIWPRGHDACNKCESERHWELVPSACKAWDRESPAKLFWSMLNGTLASLEDAWPACYPRMSRRALALTVTIPVRI